MGEGVEWTHLLNSSMYRRCAVLFRGHDDVWTKKFSKNRPNGTDHSDHITALGRIIQPPAAVNDLDIDHSIERINHRNPTHFSCERTVTYERIEYCNEYNSPPKV